MRGLMVGLSVSVAFIVGCLVSPHLVPAARAAEAAKVKYHCFEAENARDLGELSNRFATKGWRMVTGAGFAAGNVNRMVWCLEREG